MLTGTSLGTFWSSSADSETHSRCYESQGHEEGYWWRRERLAQDIILRDTKDCQRVKKDAQQKEEDIIRDIETGSSCKNETGYVLLYERHEQRETFSWTQNFLAASINPLVSLSIVQNFTKSNPTDPKSFLHYNQSTHQLSLSYFTTVLSAG